MKTKKLISMVLVIIMLIASVQFAGLLTASATGYNASAAVNYAHDHVYDGKGLCAEFVSDCLNAGGIYVSQAAYSRSTISYSGNPLGDYVVPYYSSPALLLWLSERYEVITNPSLSQMELGDVVFMNDSGGCPDGHAAIVSGFSGSTPLYSAHNYARYDSPIYNGLINYLVKMNGSVSSAKPSAPRILNLQPIYTNSNQIAISWTSASDADSYYIDVWKNNSEHVFSANVGKVTSYTLNCFGSDGKYGIAVSALNSAGITYGDYSYTHVLYTADLGDIFYATLYYKDTGKVIAASDSNNVEIQTPNSGTNQLWKFQRQSNGSYKIINMNGTGKCLDVDNNGGSQANVSIVTDNGEPAQRWYIRESSGYYRLTPICAPDCSLDICYEKTQDGTNTWIYTSNESSSQQFKIKKGCTHNYTTEITQTATCTQSGTKVFKCSICDNSYSETIPALGHNEVVVPAKAATCTETGLTEGKKCSVCNTITVPQNTIPERGHTDSDYDGMCDDCGAEVGSSEPIQPIEPTDPSDNCSHICHKTGIMKLFYQIARLFWMLFGTNKYCECGIAHY